MVPGKYNITIYKGGTFKHKITAIDSDGLAIDFSVYDSLRMQIRPLIIAESDGTIPDALLELNNTNGGITIEDSTTLYLNISAADTGALDFEVAKYDIELVINDTVPIIDKFLYGKVETISEVTI